MTSPQTAPRCFQDVILRLQGHWAASGCAILQPYDMEVGAGTFHPATTLRSLGPRPWAAAYVQPSRRPTDGRYGENPNRLQHYYQYQVIIKPSPPDLQELYLGSLRAIGLDPLKHDVRFVEDDWESPTLGAWGLGWEVWCDGMEVSQFTYFQQVGGHDCRPVSGELTYGLERLAMYVLGVEHVMDMPFNDPGSPIPLTYGDIFLQAERQYSRWNFDIADTATLLRHFEDAEAECARTLAAPAQDDAGRSIAMPLPAYDQAIKASHVFNLLDARGVISVTERQAYIGRVRALAKACADAFVAAETAVAAVLGETGSAEGEQGVEGKAAKARPARGRAADNRGAGSAAEATPGEAPVGSRGADEPAEPGQAGNTSAEGAASGKTAKGAVDKAPGGDDQAAEGPAGKDRAGEKPDGEGSDGKGPAA